MSGFRFVAMSTHRVHVGRGSEIIAQPLVVAGGAGHHRLYTLPTQRLRRVAELPASHLVGRHDGTGPAAHNDADDGIGKHGFVAAHALRQLALILGQARLPADADEEKGGVLLFKTSQFDARRKGTAIQALNIRAGILPAVLAGSRAQRSPVGHRKVRSTQLRGRPRQKAFG